MTEHGSSLGDEWGSTGDPPPSRQWFQELRWQSSYEEASVGRFLSEADAEEAGIRRKIEAARARTERARQGAAQRAASEAELGAQIVLAQRELDRLLLEHHKALVTINGAADAAVERILQAAREKSKRLPTAATIAVPRGLANEPQDGGFGPSPVSECATPGDGPDDR